jgi:hypothetical protein
MRHYASSAEPDECGDLLITRNLIADTGGHNTWKSGRSLPELHSRLLSTADIDLPNSHSRT